jgi:hypothetical protein
MDDQQRSNMKAVYSLVERATNGSGTKTYWTRVGVGFVNRDGSITLRLDAIPINGQLQVREWEPYERRADVNDPSAARPRPRTPAPSANDSLI